MRVQAFLIVLFLGTAPWAAQAQQQSTARGYFSFEYEDGQRFSPSPEGTFGNLQAGLLFTGLMENAIAYNLEVRFRTETSVEVEEAWVGMQPSEAFRFKLGFYLVPFGKYNQANRPHERRTILPPLPAETLYPASWRDVGILIEGGASAFNYALYTGNGLMEGEDLRSGQQFRDNNGDIAGGGRVGASLGEGSEIGFSYYRGHYDTSGTRSLEMRGVDASWNSSSFFLLYEYEQALMDNPVGYERGKASGHYVLVALNLRGFSPVGSYQTIDYEDPFHGSGFVAGETAGLGIVQKASRWTIGLAYYASSNVLAKVEYNFNREDVLELENDVFLAQVALHF